jgi:ADP-ribosyl-[dinitrogen reductase] hydrolase
MRDARCTCQGDKYSDTVNRVGTDLTLLDRIRGCLLGGAVGDALGAAVEFSSWGEIRDVHGDAGVTGMEAAYGRRGAITDDTQMTMFTTEGLIRAAVRLHHKGITTVTGVVWHAYQRWLVTQGEEQAGNWQGEKLDGWLIEVDALHARRAPGSTCVSALTSGLMGAPDLPINDSKGCGGVMRVAPIGLVVAPEVAFAHGIDVAAITHGHPGGYLPAGALAAMIASIVVRGASITDAVTDATALLRPQRDHEAVVRLLDRGRRIGIAGPLDASTLELLGGGWVGDEALAIAVACAVGADDFRHGVLAAANHSGDSDSTAAICGNLLGALWGVDAIPREWLAELELREEIDMLAHDLHHQFHAADKAVRSASWFMRYPGW